jgi:hypothetical protein
MDSGVRSGAAIYVRSGIDVRSGIANAPMRALFLQTVSRRYDFRLIYG